MATRQPLGHPGGGGPSAAEGILALLAWVVLDRALSLASPFRHGPTGLFQASEYAFLGALRLVEIGVALGYWRLRGWTLADLGLVGSRAARGLALGCAWAVGVAAAVVAVELAFRGVAQMSFLRLVTGRPYRGEDLVFLIVTGGLAGPAFEELLFRGFLYGGLRRQLPPLWAVALSAAVFASAHTAFQSIHPVQAAGGVLFALAYERSSSLWAPLILHVTGNIALFLAPLFL